ncbi:helix-turn-helix transcriptional regulator [Dongia sp.]|uniref:helix-turn-helix transcriptional regulator n=1 Tax=Dongia sp. TaxID=1977262 RepID=UPI0035B3E437
MDEALALSATVERIYDAAVAPELWPAVLAQIATYVEGYSAAIFSKTPTLTDSIIHHHDGRIEEAYRDSYFSHYIKLDPANTLQYFAELERPVSVSSLVPPEEMVESRFFQEWATPQGLVDFVTVALDKSRSSAALLGVFRHASQGAADEKIMRRMGLLAPHVRRAVLIGRVLEQKSAEASVFADALDSLGSALILIDRDGRILHANAAAYLLLDTAEPCRIQGGKLTFNDRAANDSLRCLLTTPASGRLPCDLRLTLDRQDGERFLAHALPLTFRRTRGGSHGAAAVICLQRAALELEATPSLIAKSYGLTPTELRVLLAIVEIGGVPETADSLGIGEGTVKTHLRRIFAKTGVARQADLVRLIATHTSPLHRDDEPAVQQRPLLAAGKR